MSQALHHYFRHPILYGAIPFAVVFLAGSALFAQSNVVPEELGGRQRHATLPFPASINIEVSSTVPPRPHAGRRIVTVQEVHHLIPKKARKELEKAERARLVQHTDDAIEHFRRAISIDPELVAARNNLGIVYLAVARPNPAIAQLEEAIKIDPNNSAVFTNLTLAYSMVHNLDAAERAARSAVALDRTGSRPRLLLGFVLVEQRKFTEEALQCLERARDEYPVAHLLAARILIAQGKSEWAKTEIQAYLSGPEQRNREIATRWLGLVDQTEQKSAEVFPH